MEKFGLAWRVWLLLSRRPFSKSDLALGGIDFEQVRPIFEFLYRAKLIGFDRDLQLFLPIGYERIRELIQACVNGQSTLAALEIAAGEPLKVWLNHFVSQGVLTLDQSSQTYRLADLSKYSGANRDGIPG